MKLILRGSILALLGVVAAVSATAGNVSKATTSTVPTITSVSAITTAEHQTITIKGKNFGTHAAYTGDSKYLQLRAFEGSAIAFEAGYEPDGDTVTLIVKSWTNTEIVLGGFAGKWGTGTNEYELKKGEVERVEVWNPQTGKGPGSFKVTVE